MEGGDVWRDVVDAFVESVDLHLMADAAGPYAVRGLDSAAVTWAAAEAGRKLDCFTLDFLGSPGEGAGAARITELTDTRTMFWVRIRTWSPSWTTSPTHVDRPTCDGAQRPACIECDSCSWHQVLALAGTGETRSWPDGHLPDRGGCLATKANRSASSSRPRTGRDSCRSGRGIIPLGSGNSGAKG